MTPRPAEEAPAPPGRPVIGHTLRFARDPFGLITECREYGPVVRREVVGRTIYQLNDPSDIERVLVGNNGNYRKGELFQRLLGPLTGDGLLTSEGERWRTQRHRVEPAFHPDRVAEYAGTMVEYTERAIEDWEDGDVVDVHGEMMALTLEIVADALFDVDIRKTAADVGAAMDAVMARSESVVHDYLPRWVPTPLNRRYERAVETLDGIVADIIETRRDEGGDDVVSMLLRAEGEDGTTMSDEAVRDEVMTLLLAGHETTALALTFTWYLLGRYPGVEATLREELAGLDGPPTMADLPELSYTEKVVRESMRLYPPVYGFLRETIEPDVLGGYRLPADATVTMSQWSVHRDPRFYDDPLAFRPERWTESFERGLPNLAYFPFSAGPRRCVGDRFAGMEARLVLATVARRYHLELITEPLSLGASITARPADPVRVRVHEREG